MEFVNGIPYLPGAAACLEQLDRTILLILRDGRHLIGTLRSFDHFLNLTLENACERIVLKNKYCDIPLGLYIVRGDNIVLYGEVDLSINDTAFQRVDRSELSSLMQDLSNAEKTEWDFDNT